MDMRMYCQKIHQVAASLPEGDIVVVSLETPEGGKAGVPCEVTRRNAARLLVENRARLATEDEAREFMKKRVEAKRAADEAAAVNRVQVTVVSASELANLKSPRPQKA